MENICKKDYAQFLEDTLGCLVRMPVSGICIVAKLRDGAVFTHYHNSGMMDKITYAGIIQQDVTLDMLKANNMVGESDG